MLAFWFSSPSVPNPPCPCPPRPALFKRLWKVWPEVDVLGVVTRTGAATWFGKNSRNSSRMDWIDATSPGQGRRYHTQQQRWDRGLCAERASTVLQACCRQHVLSSSRRQPLRIRQRRLGRANHFIVNKATHTATTDHGGAVGFHAEPFCLTRRQEIRDRRTSCYELRITSYERVAS